MILSLQAFEAGLWGWRFVAESDEAEPTFRWYVNGVFFSETRVGELELPGSRQMTVEVFDQSTPGAPMGGVAPGMELRWEGVRGGIVARYRVEREIEENVWETVAVMEESGARLYRVTVDGLADETEHVLRVMAVDVAGGEEELLTRRGFLVRVPDVPVVVVSVSDGDIVVSDGTV